MGVFHTNTLTGINEIRKSNSHLSEETKYTYKFMKLINKIFLGKLVHPSYAVGYKLEHKCTKINDFTATNYTKVCCMGHPIWEEWRECIELLDEWKNNTPAKNFLHEKTYFAVKSYLLTMKDFAEGYYKKTKYQFFICPPRFASQKCERGFAGIRELGGNKGNSYCTAYTLNNMQKSVKNGAF